MGEWLHDRNQAVTLQLLRYVSQITVSTSTCIMLKLIKSMHYHACTRLICASVCGLKNCALTSIFSAVSHLKLSVVSSKSMSLFWKEPKKSNSLMYHINYSSPMSNPITRKVFRSTNLTLTGLHPYEEYTISVQAGNRAGLSIPVNGTARTYSGGEPICG